MEHFVAEKNEKYAEEALKRLNDIATNGTPEERDRVLKILLKQNDDLRDEIKRKITERTNYVNWILVAFGALFAFSFQGMYYYVFVAVAAPIVGLSYWQYFQNSYLGHHKIVNFLRDYVEPGIQLLSGGCVRGWQLFLAEQYNDAKPKSGKCADSALLDSVKSSTSTIARRSFSVLTLIVAPIMFIALYVVHTVFYQPLPPKNPTLSVGLIGVYYLLYAVTAVLMYRREKRRFLREGIV